MEVEKREMRARRKALQVIITQVTAQRVFTETYRTCLTGNSLG